MTNFIKGGGSKFMYLGCLASSVILLVGITSVANAQVVDSSTPIVATSTIVKTTEFKSDAYKAIVKIKTYNLDDYFNLSEVSEGSGIIINSNGLILTNDHVVSQEDSFDGSDQPMAYQVCLTNDISQEPDCLYTAKIVSKNKDEDIALLQIQPVPKVSEMISFPFLELNQADYTQVNDEVMALGFPGIGGDSITTTKGIISGKSDKYGKQWIKTDAVVSFGNSGGAAIDKYGKVIGITSQAHSDLAGSIGYIINIASIKGWLSDHSGDVPQSNGLEDRINALTRKQKILTTSNKFISLYPPFEIMKPSGWSFDHNSENSVDIYDKGDEDGGDVRIVSYKGAHILNLNEAATRMKFSISADSYKEQAVKINGLIGKKFIISNSGNITNYYVFTDKEYFVSISYDYGKGEKDKKIVDSIINSFKVTSTSQPFIEIHKAIVNNTKIKISTDKNWTILQTNNKAVPLKIYNKNMVGVEVTVSLIKTDSNTASFNNEAFLNNKKQEISGANKYSSMTDIKIELVKADPHFKASKNLVDVMRLKQNIRKVAANKIVTFETSYIKKIGDKYFDVTLDYLGSDKKNADKAELEFNKFLNSISIK